MNSCRDDLIHNDDIPRSSTNSSMFLSSNNDLRLNNSQGIHLNFDQQDKISKTLKTIGVSPLKLKAELLRLILFLKPNTSIQKYHHITKKPL